MPQTLTEVQHPHSEEYQWARKRIIKDLMGMSKKDVGEMLAYMASKKPQDAISDENNMSSKIAGEIYNLQFAPPEVKGILDSTGGTTGNVLIRQDLEPLIYRLFVESFPAWERIPHLPANGLVHTATQLTTPDTSSRG